MADLYNHEGYEDLPRHILQALDRYAMTGGHLGSFLEAVVKNDLFLAIGHADPDTLRLLKRIVTYVNCRLPGGCCGSREAVRTWREEHGS